ncbi:MAG: DNA-processing protein DprA [Deltaproteobacteria bacterium]|nr:MAG: DNA-processing protein DprA [Deltaproteobacteria bacterium]
METLLPWFRLKSVPGVGNHLFKRLIDRFESPEIVLRAPHGELLEVDGMTPRLATAIKTNKLPDRAKRDYDGVIKKGIKIVTMSDPEYPPLLLRIPDPPPFLYVYGSLGDTNHCIAVVGSRNATPYGRSITRKLCDALATADLTIISGMARGIDTAAHQGALAAEGKTIAVLGSGLEKIYPAVNRNLFHQIAESGAVISEFPLDMEPEAHNFPQRNRIISGIALGTVVVEAAKNSGSLITARLAAEQNREVFAVPGSIESFKSQGAHALIKQGAKLVENVDDIFQEISHMLAVPIRKDPANQAKRAEPPLSLSPDESVVFDSLGPYPVHIDDLARSLDMEPRKISSALLQLELKGIVRQSPGKYFSITSK